MKCVEHIVTNIVNSNQTTDIKIRHLRSQIVKKIKSFKSWLVIVDNAANLTFVSSLLPELKNEDWMDGQVLITTQESRFIPPNSSFTAHVSVSLGMGVTASSNLLATVSGIGGHPMLDEVAKELDYQPLDLAAAAVYLKQVRETKVSPKFFWNDYLQKLCEGKRKLTEEQLREINPTYSLTMTTAVLLAVQKAAEADIVLSHTFRFLSLASHKSLPLEIAIKYVTLADKNLDTEQVDVKIRKCSLIIPADGKVVSIRLHRVVHDTFKVYANKSEAEEIVDSFDVAARSFYQFKYRNDIRILVPHLEAFYAAMKKLSPTNKTLCQVNPSSALKETFAYFGSVLYHYGEFVPSEYFLTGALQILKTRKSKLRLLFDGSDRHLINETKIIYNLLGMLYLRIGNLPQAQQYFKFALNICVTTVGPNHANVASFYNNLGAIHKKMGDVLQAKKLFEYAQGIFIKQLGSDHVQVAVTYTNLGTIYSVLGNFQRSKQSFKLALQIYIKQFGYYHVDVANTYSQLDGVLKDLGNLWQAKLYEESALAIRIDQLGSNHVNVAHSYSSLGSVYQEIGDLYKAKLYCERALDILMKKLGVQNVDVATSYGNLATIHQDMGDLRQAKLYHELSLDITIKQLGSNHIDVATSYNNLAILLKQLGDLQQAKDYNERALVLRTKVLGPDHVYVATSYDNLGGVHHDLGELQKAKEYHERALAIRMQ